LKKLVIFITLILLLSVAFGPAGSFAADTQSGGEEAGVRFYRLSPVRVSAQKIDEDVQQVPVSMTVFTDLTIEDIGAATVSDLLGLTPNVHLGATGTENIIVFRGVSSFDTSLFPPGGFFVDGVAFPINYMQNPDLFDVERVEILRGPQGTLYGRNTESGLVNVITRQPGETFRAKFYSGYGSYNSYTFGGSLSGPVWSDRLFAGLAVDLRGTQGFMENLYKDDDKAADESHQSGRFTLRFKPSPVWDASLILDALRTDDANGVYRYVTGPAKTDVNEINQDADHYSRQNGNGQTLRLGYQGGMADFTATTGVRYYQHDFATDGDFTPLPINASIFTYEDWNLSQELRWSSPQGPGPLKWVLGVYGFSEKTEVDYERMAAWHTVTDMKIQGLAAFGQSTYTIMDRLHMTLGMRYDYMTMTGEMDNRTSGLNFDDEMKNGEFLPKFSMAYDLCPDAMAYASVSWGYLAGGFNYSLTQIEDAFTFEPEHTLNYELGLKTSWLDKRLQVNFALFYIAIRDKQVLLVNPVTFATEINNAARAHSQGAEIEVHARPIPGLDLSAGFGLVETRFDEYKTMEWNSTYTGLVAKDYSGHHLPNAPQQTYNFGVEYRHPTGFFGRADLMGVGRFYANAANTVWEEPYSVVNLRLGYETSRLAVVLWARNLLNEEYETVKYAWGIQELAVDGDPRAVGVTVTLRY